MKRIIGVLFCVLLFSTIQGSESYTIESIPNPHTKNVLDFVSNPDGILSDETEQYLNTKLDSLEKRTTAEVAVVVVNSIGNNDITDFSNKLFTYWGIGKKEKDNGLLILFVLDQRQIRFETGYGLEGVLPDAICKRIQIQSMIPYLKNNDFNEGMKAGVDRIFLVLTDEEAAAEIYASTKSTSIKDGFMTFVNFYIFFSVIAFFIALFVSISYNKKLKASTENNYKKYKQSTSLYHSLKTGSYIFPISLLLFFFIWKIYRKKLRTTPIACSHCGAKMNLLTEKEENAFLDSKKIAEENANSIDYDVWICPSCEQKKILAYDNSFTKYDECPKCHAKTYSQTDNRTVTRASTINSGLGEKVYNCEHCHYQKIISYTIPIIIVAAGLGGRGGGGMSGGNFGGGMSGGGGSSSGF